MSCISRCTNSEIKSKRFAKLIFGFAVLSLCNSEIGAPRILFTLYTMGIPILKLVHREIYDLAGKKISHGPFKILQMSFWRNNV